MDTQGHDDQLAEMRRELAELRAEVGRLREQPEGDGGAAVAEAADQSRSRRQLFRGAAAAGAGLAVATIASRPAAAADGDNVIIGQANTGSTETSLTTAATDGFTVTTSTDNANALIGESTASAMSGGTGVRGTAASFFGIGVDGVNERSTGSTIGVRGTSLSPSGQGVFGGASSGIGVLGVAQDAGGLGGQFRGPRAALYIQSSGTEAPQFLADSHNAGEIQLDDEDNLWVCVGSGTPGAWRLIAGPGSAGAVNVVEPYRAFDSRFTDAGIAASENQVIRVSDAIDVDDGTTVQTDAIPAGATAVFFNVTVTGTLGSGFLSVTPGDAVEVASSSINWSGPGTTVANGSLVKLDDARQVKVFCGGAPGTSAQYIIDITGYTI